MRFRCLKAPSFKIVLEEYATGYAVMGTRLSHTSCLRQWVTVFVTFGEGDQSVAAL